MASMPQLDPVAAVAATAAAAASHTSDAVRSRAWRDRQAYYLREIVRLSGADVGAGTESSCMAQLKRIHAPLWAATVAAEPALPVRHDATLPRRERRRMSSIKNNRLCRLRYARFLDAIEAALVSRGVPVARLLEIKGLRAG